MKEASFWVKLKISVFSYLAYFLVYLLHKTLRYEVYGKNHFEEAQKKHPLGSVLIATWHQNTILSVTSLSLNPSFSILVSSSLDGEIISFVGHKLGLQSFRGSSSRGGRKALLELNRYVKEGGKIAITVDGPRGPAFTPKSGILFLSGKNKAPILPMCCIASSYWTFTKSWDQFRVPKPFSKVKVKFGPSFVCGEKEELFRDAQKLKERLCELS